MPFKFKLQATAFLRLCCVLSRPSPDDWLLYRTLNNLFGTQDISHTKHYWILPNAMAAWNVSHIYNTVMIVYKLKLIFSPNEMGAKLD